MAIDLRRNLRWVQHKQAARGGLKRGDELLRRNIVRQNRANPRAQRRGRSSERRRLRKKDDAEIGRQARSDERIKKWCVTLIRTVLNILVVYSEKFL